MKPRGIDTFSKLESRRRGERAVQFLLRALLSHKHEGFKSPAAAPVPVPERNDMGSKA